MNTAILEHHGINIGNKTGYVPFLADRVLVTQYSPQFIAHHATKPIRAWEWLSSYGYVNTKTVGYFILFSDLPKLQEAYKPIHLKQLKREIEISENLIARFDLIRLERKLKQGEIKRYNDLKKHIKAMVKEADTIKKELKQ